MYAAAPVNAATAASPRETRIMVVFLAVRSDADSVIQFAKVSVSPHV